MAERNPVLAPVDDYPEAPYDKVKAPERVEHPQHDQIADYHQTHPTLDTSDKAHDPAYQQKALEKALEKDVVVTEPEYDPKQDQPVE